MSADYNETQKQGQPAQPSEGSGYAIDFDSDVPLVCSRDQSGDTTCESCQ